VDDLPGGVLLLDHVAIVARVRNGSIDPFSQLIIAW
jgi:hypothetical protein